LISTLRKLWKQDKRKTNKKRDEAMKQKIYWLLGKYHYYVGLKPPWLCVVGPFFSKAELLKVHRLWYRDSKPQTLTMKGV